MDFLTVSLEESGWLLSSEALIEACTLVLVDPFSDGLSLNLTSIGEGLWVGSVWKSKVQMMSRVLNVQDHSVWADILEDATSVPWVQRSITEDNVGSLGEVALWIHSTEVLQSPVVLWSLAEGSLAVGSVAGLVPLALGEHGVVTASEWHDHLVASLDGPATVVETLILTHGNVEAELWVCGIVVID